jgi:hypothetical protein
MCSPECPRTRVNVLLDTPIRTKASVNTFNFPILTFNLNFKKLKSDD